MRASRDSSAKLILGLGNPGGEYAGTYHSVGNIFVDRMANLLGVGFSKLPYFAYAKSPGFILVKSLINMNESGVAAAAALKYFKVPLQKLYVAHDDSDLTIGSFKITSGQSAAGHHGIESVINTLGTAEFSRIRIGIRPLGEARRKKAGELVLKPISKSNTVIIEEVFGRIYAELV
ncbi:MAG: aminoacyl-tRNA hydrolase [Patescibacteria group bacterium]|nr:aminoacyl-tRNA hydrolase [Patescibacteria group bacterium]MCL5224354.1 aminoacyl-tRNA hydrolase [Patescibacteria group bacterium]